MSVPSDKGAFALEARHVRVSNDMAVTSAEDYALAVGLNGATNPALQVDASTALSATGLKVKSAAAAGGLAVSVISSGTNEALTIDAKGSGIVTIGSSSTGGVTIAQGGLRVTAGGIIAPAVAVADELTLTSAHAGRLLSVTSAAGYAITLPTMGASLSGYQYRIAVGGADLSAGAVTITAGTNIIRGILMETTDGVQLLSGTTITLTTGATRGTMVDLETDGTTWFVKAYARTQNTITIA